MSEYPLSLSAVSSQDRGVTPFPQKKRLSPLLKWAGGKEQELKHILPFVPPFQHYYEPFVGGGAVFFALQSFHSFINDRSPELYTFYTMVARQDTDFFRMLETLLWNWHCLTELFREHAPCLLAAYKAYSHDCATRDDLHLSLLNFLQVHQTDFEHIARTIYPEGAEKFLHELQRNLFNKTERMRIIERRKWQLPDKDIMDNMEAACKSAFYMYIRYLYNHIHTLTLPSYLAAALFFFVREMAYASMFRYNRQGAFNVPYGGISYNHKDLSRKVASMRSMTVQSLLSHTVIENMDFEAFLIKYSPGPDDFIFLDPPYDSGFSTYARNEFTTHDQERLADYLLKQCQAKFMLVIKNTPTIERLYTNKGLHIQAFNKKYMVSFQDRNNKDAEHLIIMNY